MTVRTAKGRAV